MANDAMDKIESMAPFRQEARCYDQVTHSADNSSRAEQLQEVIQDLYVLSVQVHAYQGPETTEAMIYQMWELRCRRLSFSLSLQDRPHDPQGRFYLFKPLRPRPYDHTNGG